VPLNRRSSAILQNKNQHRRSCDFHLLVVTRCLQRLPARQQRVINLPHLLHRCPVNGRGNPMQLRIGSIQNNHSVCAEQPRIESRKRRAQRFAGTIRLA